MASLRNLLCTNLLSVFYIGFFSQQDRTVKNEAEPVEDVLVNHILSKLQIGEQDLGQQQRPINILPSKVLTVEELVNLFCMKITDVKS